MDLLELAERVEAASGPDRMLDGEIARALDPDADWYQFRDTWGFRDPADSVVFITPPEFSASLDAAMTLAPEGCTWRLDYVAARHGQQALGSAFVLSPPASGQAHHGDAATPALALTAACLRAIAASQDAPIPTTQMEER